MNEKIFIITQAYGLRAHPHEMLNQIINKWWKKRNQTSREASYDIWEENKRLLFMILQNTNNLWKSWTIYRIKNDNVLVSSGSLLSSVLFFLHIKQYSNSEIFTMLDSMCACEMLNVLSEREMLKVKDKWIVFERTSLFRITHSR